MKWKTTLVLLLVTVGVGAYVSLYELKQPTSERREELAKQVVQIAPDEVTSLAVALPQGTTQLARQDGGWRLVSPLQARADESRVRRALSQLDPLTAQRVLESSKDNPLPLADFGLDPPRGTLSVTTKEGKTTALQFGDPTPVQDNRYLKLPDVPVVFVVNDGLFEDLNRPAEAYRSTELLSFDTWKVTTMSVASSSSSYTLTKQGERWQLIQPLTDDAESAAYTGLLSALRNLKVERFITDRPEGSRIEWGLDQPSVRISLTLEKAEPPLELTVGNVTTDHAEQSYAKRSDEPTIYAVSTASIQELLKDPQALRASTVLDVFASQVTKVELTWQDVSWTIEKLQGQWKMSAGQEILDTAKVEEWVWKLRDLKLVRFVDDPADGGAGVPTDLAKYGLAPPQGRLLVWVAGQSDPRQLLVGQLSESGKTRYGQVVGRPSVVEYPENLEELLTTTPDSLKPSPPPTEAGTTAEGGGR